MTECDSGLPEGEARCLAVWGGLSRHCPSSCRSNGVGKPPKRTLPSAAPRQLRQARPQKASRIWYHTAPPCTEADTPSLTNPNLA